MVPLGVLDILIQQYENPYFFFLNCSSAFAFLIDKLFAISHFWRVRKLPLLFCCLNAPVGSLLSMIVFWHKVRKPLFPIVTLVGFTLMFNTNSVFYSDGLRFASVLNLVVMLLCTVLRF